MSRLAPLAAVAVRAAGGDPAVVLPLTTALRRDARGQQELLRTRQKGRFVLTAEGAHTLVLVLAGLASVFLALGVILLADRPGPPWGALLIAGAQVVFLTASVVGQTVPALLCDDDGRAVGWWPVARRDLLLARLGTVVIPALQTSAALALLPLVAFAFVGRPAGLAALALALALVLQLLLIAVAAAAGTAAAVRAAGPRRARRLAALMVDGNLAALPFLALPFAEEIAGFVKSHPGLLDWLPPAWFGWFGAPLAGPEAWRAMGLALLLCVAVGGLGWRVATVRRAAPAPRVEARGGRVRRHWTDLVPWLLRPWLRDREGWVTGRLLAAHLREDWRFGGNMVFIVAICAAMLWYYTRPDAGDPDVRFDLVMGGGQTLMLLSIYMPFAVGFSSTPRALWPVALADLDPVRLLAGQRALMRGLFLAPVAALFGARALLLGEAPAVVLLMLAVLVLEADLLVIAGQRIQPVLAFSRAYTRDQSSRAMMRGLAVIGVYVLVMAANAVAAEWLPGRVVLVLALPAAHVLLRRSLARRVAGSRLNVEEILA